MTREQLKNAKEVCERLFNNYTDIFFDHLGIYTEEERDIALDKAADLAGAIGTINQLISLFEEE